MSDHKVVVLPARNTPRATYQTSVPSLFARDEAGAKRTFEFFAVRIRNPSTRRAYGWAAADFAAWCELHRIADVRQVQPVQVAAYIDGLQISASSIKQRLAALRTLFDWLVVGQVMPMNPASSVRGPRHSLKKGKTAVLAAEEVRALLDAIDTNTLIGLRDRALIGLMVYTFARVGAAISMRVEDVYVLARHTWVRLHEKKRGKQHQTPCHHNLGEWLLAYIEGAQLIDGKAYLFRTVVGRTGQLSARPMAQADAFRMISRRAEAAGIRTRISCHTFRATGITEYLRNGGKLEIAQQMAHHKSARTTSLYDHRTDQVNLDEIERIVI